MQQLGKRIYKLLGTLGIVKFSGKKNIYGLHPLIISSLIITATILLANILRKLVKLILPENFIREVLLEIIATAELCACCFELIIVADNYGVLTYAIFLFMLTIWWSSTWDSASACPYSTIEEVLEGYRDVKKGLIIIISQVLGGLVIFSYIKCIWSIELAQTHIGRVNQECVADLAVPMSHGAAIEGLATFLCRVISRIMNESNVRFANIFDAFIGTALVVAAFNSSGGYFNPALATSLKFGCEGNTFIEHFVVYWMGATAGSIASVYFIRLPFVKSYLSKYKEKED